MSTHRPPVEPSADLRQAAKALREMYIALTSEGFSPSETLVILGHAISANTNGGR